MHRNAHLQSTCAQYILISPYVSMYTQKCRMKWLAIVCSHFDEISQVLNVGILANNDGILVPSPNSCIDTFPCFVAEMMKHDINNIYELTPIESVK